VREVGFPLHESKYFSDRDQARKRMIQNSVFDFRQNKNFLFFFKTSTFEVGPTKTLIQKLSGAKSSGKKRLVREAGCSGPTGASITNA
jgi:hypothetical protein